jgi:hypothetical protein
MINYVNNNGVFFFTFQGTYAGGERGWKWVKMKIIQLFFALIEDFGCSFKLNLFLIKPFCLEFSQL